MKNVILVTGYKQSGKDSFADITGYKKLGFADKLKEQAEQVIEILFPDIAGYIKYDWEDDEFKKAEIPSKFNKINKRTGKRSTFRDFLEDYGTGLVRDNINDEYYAQITVDRIRRSKEKNFVIKDTRFLSEYEIFYTKPLEFNLILVYIDRGYQCENPLTEGEVEKLRDLASYDIDSTGDLAGYQERCKFVFNEIKRGL